MKQPRKSSTERKPKGGGDAPVTVMLSDTLPQPPRKFHGRIGTLYTNSQADVPAMPAPPAGAPNVFSFCWTTSASATPAPSEGRSIRQHCNDSPMKVCVTTAFIRQPCALPRARLC